MRIEEEIKLDYSDVLFRPKRSTLKSRKEVDLSRTYKFKHSNREWDWCSNYSFKYGWSRRVRNS